jgi:hypothetical protein
MFVTNKMDSVRGNQWQSDNGNNCMYADPWSSYGYSELADGTDPFRIGTDYLAPSDWWYGRIGELHVSCVCRSDDWDKADYNSQNDSLLNFGTPTAATPATASGVSPVPAP